MKKLLTYILIAFVATSCSMSQNAQQGNYGSDQQIRKLHPQPVQVVDYRSNAQTGDNTVANAPKAGRKCSCPCGDNCQCCANALCCTGGYAIPAGVEGDGKDLMRQLLGKSYEIVEYDFTPEVPKAMTWVDEPVTEPKEELLAKMNINGSRYMPRGSTMAQSENDMYFYFTQGIDKPEPLHFRVQYYADDPLEYSKIIFLIDGFEYEYKPDKTNRGREGKRMYWENSDEPLKSTDKDLAYALSHCNWAQAKIIGDRGVNHVRMLTDDQIKRFYNTLKLYILLGGEL
ncbi:MAG: hypothetical protein J6X81_02155 [Muribaculaceae bacterium]|nr:hypothetical protein [Muribaculaceae bacterium]